MHFSVTSGPPATTIAVEQDQHKKEKEEKKKEATDQLTKKTNRISGRKQTKCKTLPHAAKAEGSRNHFVAAIV